MLPDLDIVYEPADEKEPREIAQFMEEQQRLKEREAAEKKARRAEINRKIAEEKKKRKMENDKQLSLLRREPQGKSLSRFLLAAMIDAPASRDAHLNGPSAGDNILRGVPPDLKSGLRQPLHVVRTVASDVIGMSK